MYNFLSILYSKDRGKIIKVLRKFYRQDTFIGGIHAMRGGKNTVEIRLARKFVELKISLATMSI